MFARRAHPRCDGVAAADDRSLPYGPCHGRGYVVTVWRSEEADVASAGPDRLDRVGAQSLRQEFMINVTKVVGALEVSVIEIGQAWLVTVETTPDRCTGNDDRSGRAVVSALRCVGTHPATKLAVNQHHDVLAVLVGTHFL